MLTAAYDGMTCLCSSQDVLAGLVLGVLVLCGLILPYIDAVDEYLVTNTYSPIALSVVIALSVLLYPAGNTWTPARSVSRPSPRSQCCSIPPATRGPRPGQSVAPPPALSAALPRLQHMDPGQVSQSPLPPLSVLLYPAGNTWTPARSVSPPSPRSQCCSTPPTTHGPRPGQSVAPPPALSAALHRRQHMDPGQDSQSPLPPLSVLLYPAGNTWTPARSVSRPSPRSQCCSTPLATHGPRPGQSVAPPRSQCCSIPLATRGPRPGQSVAPALSAALPRRQHVDPGQDSQSPPPALSAALPRRQHMDPGQVSQSPLPPLSVLLYTAGNTWTPARSVSRPSPRSQCCSTPPATHGPRPGQSVAPPPALSAALHRRQHMDPGQDSQSPLPPLSVLLYLAGNTWTPARSVSHPPPPSRSGPVCVLSVPVLRHAPPPPLSSVKAYSGSSKGTCAPGR